MNKSIHKHSTKVCALIPAEVLHHHVQVKYLIGLKTNNGYQYNTDPTAPMTGASNPIQFILNGKLQYFISYMCRLTRQTLDNVIFFLKHTHL